MAKHYRLLYSISLKILIYSKVFFGTERVWCHCTLTFLAHTWTCLCHRFESLLKFLSLLFRLLVNELGSLFQLPILFWCLWNKKVTHKWVLQHMTRNQNPDLSYGKPTHFSENHDTTISFVKLKIKAKHGQRKLSCLLQAPYLEMHLLLIFNCVGSLHWNKQKYHYERLVTILKGILWDCYRNAFLIMKLSTLSSFRAIQVLIASQSKFEI